MPTSNLQKLFSDNLDGDSSLDAIKQRGGCGCAADVLQVLCENDRVAIERDASRGANRVHNVRFGDRTEQPSVRTGACFNPDGALLNERLLRFGRVAALRVENVASLAHRRRLQLGRGVGLQRRTRW